MESFDISSLPDEARAWIEEKIASGLYHSPEEVFRSAARALEAFELHQKVLGGAQEIDRGEGREYDDRGLDELRERIKRQGRERLETRRQTA